MYGMFRIRSKDGETVPSAYFLAHEGSAGIEGGQPYTGGPPAPAGSRTYPDYVTGWNKMLEAYGASSDYYFAAPPSTTRLENAKAAIQDSITYWTGYKFDKTEVDTQYGCKVYKNTFNGVDDFLAVIVENRGHMPSGYDANYIWDFLSQWKRNTNTKQSEKFE
jgi:hypothetical protein